MIRPITPIMALIAAAAILIYSPDGQAQPTTTADRELSVSAEQPYFSAPQAARITVQLESTGATAGQALSGLEQTASKVMQAVKSQAAEALISGRREDYSSAAQQPAITPASAVRIQRQLSVDITAREKVAAIIDQMLHAGASAVLRVEHLPGTDNRPQLDALQKAAEKAKTKAQLAASAVGAKIIGILSVSTADDPSPSVLRQGLEQGPDGLRLEEHDRVASVTIRYQIEQPQAGR